MNPSTAGLPWSGDGALAIAELFHRGATHPIRPIPRGRTTFLAACAARPPPPSSCSRVGGPDPYSVRSFDRIPTPPGVPCIVLPHRDQQRERPASSRAEEDREADGPAPVGANGADQQEVVRLLRPEQKRWDD